MTQRQFRILLVCSIMSAFIGGALVQMGFKAVAPVQAQGERIVQAHRFELIDRAGFVRAELGMGEKGMAYLEFTNEAGETFILGQHVDGREVLRMLGTNGTPRTVLRAHRDGMSQLTLFGNDGQSAALMAVFDQGELLIALRDKEGKTIWRKP
jgi:hypothetical protein